MKRLTGQDIADVAGNFVALIASSAAWIVLFTVWAVFLAVKLIAQTSWSWWYLGVPGVILGVALIILLLCWHK